MRPILVIVALGAGCGSVLEARPIAALPVCPVERVAPSSARITIAPFVDGRGGEFARVRHWPIFARVRVAYPENAGAFVDRDRVVAVGSLDTALPVLLARTMQAMELSPSVAVGDAPPNGSMDWIVSGRLLRADVTRARSGLVAATVGLLGVPFGVERAHLEYEVWVASVRDPLRPVFHRSYAFDGRVVVGHYYGQHADYDLLLRALDATLPAVVRDVSTLVHAG